MWKAVSMGSAHLWLTPCACSPAPLHPPSLPSLTAHSLQGSGLWQAVRESTWNPVGLHLELKKEHSWRYGPGKLSSLPQHRFDDNGLNPRKYQLEKSENKGELSVQDPWNSKMPAFLKALRMLVFQIQYGKPYFAHFYSCHLVWVHYHNLQKPLTSFYHLINKFMHNFKAHNI